MLKRNNFFLPLFFFFIVIAVFFHKTVLYGHLPFPGDLQISEYTPWKYYSYIGYVPGSYPSKVQYFDVIRQLYPWKYHSIGQLKDGILPLWNPYNFSGSPLFANFQSAVLYPLNIFYFIFPFLTAWTVLIIFQPLLAAIFMYLYMKKIGVSVLGSLFASISYACCGFMSVWLEYNTIGHVIAWFPLGLFAIEQIIEGKKNFYIFLLPLCIVFSLFAGHVQLFGYELIFWIMYTIVRISQTKIQIKNTIIFTFLLIGIGVGLGGVMLIPGIELLMNSARAAHDYTFLIEKILIQPYQLIMILVPDLFGNPATHNYFLPDTYVGKVTYVGIAAFFFSLLAILQWKNKFVKIYGVTSVIVLLTITNNPLTKILYSFNLPFLSSSSPTLSVFLFSFALCVLAGIGIDIFLREKIGKKEFIKWIRLTSILVTILGVLVVSYPSIVSLLDQYKIVALRNLFVSSVILGLVTGSISLGLVKKNSIHLIVGFLLIVQIADLGKGFIKFNPFIPQEIVFPQTSLTKWLQKDKELSRVWGYGNARLDANIATYYSFFSPDGYDPLYPRIYGEFIQSSGNGQLTRKFTTSTRSDAIVVPGFGKEDLSKNTYRLKVLDLLGVKYVIDRVENGSDENTFPQNRFTLIDTFDGWKIYRNNYAIPRLQLLYSYTTYASQKEFEQKFFSFDFSPAKTVLLENSLTGEYSLNQEVDGKAILKSYKPEKIEASVITNSPALLFLSDTYYPGWKAFIDGQETRIHKANYTFRVIEIPQGKHEILFIYDPVSLKIGKIISLISIFLCIGLGLWYKERYNKAHE